MTEPPWFIDDLTTRRLAAIQLFAAGALPPPVTVFTNTALASGTWATVDNDGVTPFTLFPGTGVGNASYVGAAETFESVEASVVTALASAAESENLAVEFWDGGAWTPIATMMTNAVPPYESYTNTIFSEAIAEQIRLGPRPSWTPLSLNRSVPLFWVRVVVAVAIAVNPVLTRLAAQALHLEINQCGDIQRFGGVVRFVPWDLNVAAPADNSPGNQDVFFGQTVGVGRTENLFSSGVVDRTGLNFYLPSGADTSKGLRVRATWLGTSAAAGDVRWTLRVAGSQDGDSVFRTAGAAPVTAPGQETVIIDQPGPGAVDVQMTVTAFLPVETINARPPAGNPDLVWVSVERTANAAEDTYPGTVALISLMLDYIEVFEGDCLTRV